MERNSTGTGLDSLPMGRGVLQTLAEQLERLDGFAEVQASLAAGHSGTLGGVWGSSCALAAAAIGGNCPASLVIVAPRPAMIDTLADDLALFSSQPVARLNASQQTASQQVALDPIEGERLRVVKQLAAGSGKIPLVVTCIQALMQPVPSPDALADATRRLAVGESIDLEEWAEWLVKRGCHATSAVELPGEFALRGGLLDIFPPDALAPVRIELFGDEIESIRQFDVATQRRVAGASGPHATRSRNHTTDPLYGLLTRGKLVLFSRAERLERRGAFFPRAARVARPAA